MCVLFQNDRVGVGVRGQGNMEAGQFVGRRQELRGRVVLCCCLYSLYWSLAFGKEARK